MSYTILSTYEQEFPKLPTAVIKPKIVKSRKQKEFTKTVPSSTKSSTFTQFPHFPAELCLKIYNMAFQSPRTVKVKLTKIGTTPPNDNGIKLPKLGLQYLPGSSVPGLLHVNQEARDEGLKVYKSYFEGGKMDAKQNTIYVHPQLDTVLIILPTPEFKDDRHEFQSVNFEQGNIDAIAHTEEYWVTRMIEGYFQDTGAVAVMPADSEGLGIHGFREFSCVLPWYRSQAKMGWWEKTCLEWLIDWRLLCIVFDLLSSAEVLGLDSSGVYGS